MFVVEQQKGDGNWEPQFLLERYTAAHDAWRAADFAFRRYGVADRVRVRPKDGRVPVAHFATGERALMDLDMLGPFDPKPS